MMSSKLPDSEKTLPHLVQNGGLIISAGTVSTAWALAVGVFYVLHKPSVLQKLQAELVAAVPHRSASVDLIQLEQLPYLAAVIQEALRLSVGGTHRSQRISPNEATVFSDRDTGNTWSIPSGTPMSMSHFLLFRDETIFPNHEKFDPERWLGRPSMDRYVISQLPFLFLIHVLTVPLLVGTSLRSAKGLETALASTSQWPK